MKLSLYFAKLYARTLMLMELGLIVMVLATTVVENAGKISNHDESGLTVLKIAALGAVQFGYQVFPIACFLGVVVAGTLLAQRGELLAMQAAGISNVKVSATFGLVATGASIIALLAGEHIVPPMTARLERLQQEELGLGKNALTHFYDRRMQWFREGPLLLYLPDMDTTTATFSNVVVYRLDKGLISAVLNAKEMSHDGQTWKLQIVREQDLHQGVTRWHEQLPLNLRVSPRDVIDVAGDPRVMSRSAIAGLIERRSKAGIDTAAHTVELHSRYAFPLSGLALFFLGLSWALNPNRRRSMSRNLGLGVVIVALFLSLTQVFRLLALARRIPSPLGSWGIDLSILLFVPVSVFLYQRYRKRGSLF